MISWIVFDFIFVFYSNVSQLTFLLLDAWPWLEESYKFSVPVRRSTIFLGIGSLIFFELNMVLGDHVVFSVTEPYFSK